jgi:hypothetical protein
MFSIEIEVCTRSVGMDMDICMGYIYDSVGIESIDTLSAQVCVIATAIIDYIA